MLVCVTNKYIYCTKIIEKTSSSFKELGPVVHVTPLSEYLCVKEVYIVFTFTNYSGKKV